VGENGGGERGRVGGEMRGEINVLVAAHDLFINRSFRPSLSLSLSLSFLFLFPLLSRGSRRARQLAPSIGPRYYDREREEGGRGGRKDR